jgi:MscS family membrane protein
MGIVEAGGSGFAFPSQTLYMSRDPGLDAEKGRAAADAVGRWRDQGELPFPDHAPDRIAQLDNTLEYPPRESAVHAKKNV